MHQLYRNTNGNQIRNGGGGFVSNLEAGDRLSVWGASSHTTNLTIYDANLGLEMAVHASLKS